MKTFFYRVYEKEHWILVLKIWDVSIAWDICSGRYTVNLFTFATYQRRGMAKRVLSKWDSVQWRNCKRISHLFSTFKQGLSPSVWKPVSQTMKATVPTALDDNLLSASGVDCKSRETIENLKNEYRICYHDVGKRQWLELTISAQSKHFVSCWYGKCTSCGTFNAKFLNNL